MAVKKAVKDKAVTVKTLAAELCRQFDLIAELRVDLEATRDEVGFPTDDVQDLQAVTITKKRGAKNGR